MDLLKKLNECLSYDPATGNLAWTKRGRGRVLGKSPYLNHHHQGGYVSFQFRFDGKNIRVYVHRFAFGVMKGHWPTETDHVDRDPTNNRWANLRECTRTENHLNHGLRKDNTSGVVGVKKAPGGKWRVTYRQKNYGTFNTIEEAAEKRKELEER